MYFEYGKKEIDYLTSKDRLLGEAIHKIGIIKRKTDDDLFSAVVHHIIGQQISTKAQETIWQRLRVNTGTIEAEKISSMNRDALQSIGISFRKADYIKDFSNKVIRNEFNLQEIYNKTDDEVITSLISLKGIGVWTAEMLMIFCLKRPDIVSFGDLAILRGMRMLYHHRTIDKKKFEQYRRRYSPYGSVASLYLWAISGGAIAGMKDYAPKKIAKKRR